MNSNLFDFTKVHLRDFLHRLKIIDEPSESVKSFIQSIDIHEEYTLLTILENSESWNEYEITLLAKYLIKIDKITNFSPNCIKITMENTQPTKENILKELARENYEIFSLIADAKVIEEYEVPTDQDNYRFSLGVLLYALSSGTSNLPSRFRGIRKYNLASNLEKFFTKEAFDDNFKKLVIDLVNNTINMNFIKSSINSIINKFKKDKPYAISTKLISSTAHKDYNEFINVSLGQLVYNPLGYFNFEVGTSTEPDCSRQIDIILQYIDEASKESDILILPELALPRKYINPIKRKLRLMEKDLMLICGISYKKHNAKIMLNQGILLNRNNEIVFDKLEASPTIETKQLDKEGMKLKPTSKINIYEDTIVGKFSVLICYDFLSLPIHDLLHKKIDTLFILAYNTDINGFEFTAEAFVRMSLMNVVIVNCGNYGGSLAISPLRDPHKRVRLLIKGNDIDSVNTVKIPIKSLNQYKSNRKLNKTNFLCQDKSCKIPFIEYPAHFREIKK